MTHVAAPAQVNEERPSKRFSLHGKNTIHVRLPISSSSAIPALEHRLCSGAGEIAPDELHRIKDQFFDDVFVMLQYTS